MSFLASLALVSLLSPQGSPAPQGGGQDNAAGGKPPVLTPAERTTLRDRLARYLVEDAAYSLSTGKERDKASRAREKAKEAFDDEWKKAEKKGNVMGSMADLRAIFENCFTMKQPSVTLGQLRPEKHKASGLDYHVYLPKAYKAATPHRTVLVLPGTATADNPAWMKGADYFNATWDKSASLADTIFHVPTPPAGLELDPIPDFSRESGDAEEQKRIEMTWIPFGEVIQTYNIDRGRVYLDCGRGASGFGLRLMTMFPDRFAGAVLRAPVEVDDLRLGSLHRLPILMLRTAATAAVVDALKKRLDEISPNAVTVLDVADEYPHRGHTADIEAWLKDKKRSLTPDKVVIEPNHDKFNRAYWADIDVADPLLTAAADKKPRLECQADRAANRITVKAVGVERFTLFLNDDLIDLDKEFTVVINDKAVTEKKTRNFRDLRERVVVRNDWECLFPVTFSTAVPK